MPVAFDIDVEWGIVIVAAGGRVSAAELLDARARVLSHPYYRPDLDLIFDARGLTRLLDVSSWELRRLTAKSRGTDGSRQVIVMQRISPYHHGSSRIYELQRAASEPDSPVMICETLLEAVELLKRS